MTEGPGLGLQANVGADIVLAVGSVKEEIRRLRSENAEDRVQRSLSRIKNYLPLTGFTTLTAAGSGVVDLGSPSLGRVWTVRQLMAALNGSELATGVAITLGWYIGVIPAAQIGLPGLQQITAQWRASMTTVPSYTTFTSDILQVKGGEHLFAVAATGPPNGNLVLNAMVLDEPAKVGVPTSAS